MNNLEIDDLVQYLIDKCGCTAEEADAYVTGEDEYLSEVGISGYGREDGQPALSDEDAANTIIDQREVEDYIIEHKGLARGLVERMSQAEYDYMEMTDMFGYEE